MVIKSWKNGEKKREKELVIIKLKTAIYMYIKILHVKSTSCTYVTYNDYLCLVMDEIASLKQ